ncbi:hypothetical protein E2C01_067817 [Portunus trituberculatus]|uniref:Uncharacterized protein n=1 Tax=Portunus trituberculatus TaxID=210409 RepID=A0A5B7HUM8_PORTR|nr:hypothetical protein [Portunus trituberculatus]
MATSDISCKGCEFDYLEIIAPEMQGRYFQCRPDQDGSVATTEARVVDEDTATTVMHYSGYTHLTLARVHPTQPYGWWISLDKLPMELQQRGPAHSAPHTHCFAVRLLTCTTSGYQ